MEHGVGLVKRERKSRSPNGGINYVSTFKADIVIDNN